MSIIRRKLMSKTNQHFPESLSCQNNIQNKIILQLSVQIEFLTSTHGF